MRLRQALLLPILLSGCTVTKPPVALPPMPAPTVAATPTPPPEIEPPEPLVEETPQDPDIIKALQKHEKTKKFSDAETPAVMKYVFDPTRIYTLKCPEWGVLTIRLLPGEVLRRIAAGNPVEWMIEDTTIGLGEESAIITLRRAPYAEPAQMTAYTNINIYEFLLLPGGPLGNGRTRQVMFWDPEAELQRWKNQVAHAKAMEERRKQAEANRVPTLSSEHVRYYDIGGDSVNWRPVQVVGDHQHTMVFLPTATGAEQPTLTAIRDGEETQVNYRTIPGRNGNGPVIVADQALPEARLTGEGGVVRITGRGN